MWRELKADIISTASSRGSSYEELLEVMTCTTARLSLYLCEDTPGRRGAC